MYNRLMPPDKYAATWVSHTSLTTFSQCPRAYYLKHVYKDPATNHKIQPVSPSLALGQTIHTVLESLSVLPTKTRFAVPLVEKFNQIWSQVSGLKGGFQSGDEEAGFKARGEEMLRRVELHPGPLKNLAVKINTDLPQYWLSETDNIILCGKLDWLEYLPEADAVHIIDFKTSKKEEASNSLQLPIYYLLATKCQKRPVAKASYWYLSFRETLTPKALPTDIAESENQILKTAKAMKLARSLNRFKCPQGEVGCHHCRPYEAILRGKATFVGTNDYQQDIYVAGGADDPESEIL